MTAAKKKSAPDKKMLFTAYMTAVLETEKYPRSVYGFCKDNKISEAEFYKHFGSLESLRKKIWESFLEQTLELIQKDKQYQGYGNREKMLSFFYTFFELLTLNRSYVLFALESNGGTPLKQMEQLSGLRKGVRAYAQELIRAANEDKTTRLTRQSPELFSEGAWVQLLFLIRFWMRDDSSGFEKTDLAIEKSVNTIFDIFDNTPLESVLDFGKFLFKEKMS